MSAPKHIIWVVFKELKNGMFTSCRYNSRIGPVDEEHVRNATPVKEWLGRDRLYEIYPAPIQNEGGAA